MITTDEAKEISEEDLKSFSIEKVFGITLYKFQKEALEKIKND